MRKIILILFLVVLLWAGNAGAAHYFDETFEGTEYDHTWTEVVTGTSNGDKLNSAVTGAWPNQKLQCYESTVATGQQANITTALAETLNISGIKIEVIFGSLPALGEAQYQAIGGAFQSAMATNPAWILNILESGGGLYLSLKMYLDNASFITITSTHPLAINTLYRIEIFRDVTSGVYGFRINDIDQGTGDGTGSDIDPDTAYTVGGLAVGHFGLAFGQRVASTYYFDNIEISAVDYPGITPIDPDSIKISLLGDPHYSVTHALVTAEIDKCEDMTDYIEWSNVNSCDILITDGDNIHSYGTNDDVDSLQACCVAASPKYPILLGIGNHDPIPEPPAVSYTYGGATTIEVNLFVDRVNQYGANVNSAIMAHIPERNWAINIGPDITIIQFDNSNYSENADENLLSCTDDTLTWLEAEFNRAIANSKKVILVAHGSYDAAYPGNPPLFLNESAMYTQLGGAFTFDTPPDTAGATIGFQAETGTGRIAETNIGENIYWTYTTGSWNVDASPTFGWGTILSFNDTTGIGTISILSAVETTSCSPYYYSCPDPKNTVKAGECLSQSKYSQSGADIQALISAAVLAGLDIQLAIAGHSHRGTPINNNLPITRTYGAVSVPYYVTHSTSIGYTSATLKDIGAHYLITVTPTGYTYQPYPLGGYADYLYTSWKDPTSNATGQGIAFTDATDSSVTYYGTWKQLLRSETVEGDDIIDGQKNFFDLGGKISPNSSGSDGHQIIWKNFEIDTTKYATDCFDTAGYDYLTVQQSKFNGVAFGIDIDAGSTNIAVQANIFVSANGIQNNSATAITAYNNTFYGETLGIDANGNMTSKNNIYWGCTTSLDIDVAAEVTGDYDWCDGAIPDRYTDGGHSTWSGADPLFVSAIDFRLRKKSPCRKAGLFTAGNPYNSIVYDFAGRQMTLASGVNKYRSEKPIGAYMYWGTQRVNLLQNIWERTIDKIYRLTPMEIEP